MTSSSSSSYSNNNNKETTPISEEAPTENGVQITCFSQVVDDVTLHFQIIRLHKQIYAWIGCNSAKFGHLYAAAPTRPVMLFSFVFLPNTDILAHSHIPRRQDGKVNSLLVKVSIFAALCALTVLFSSYSIPGMQSGLVWYVQSNAVSFTSLIGGSSDNVGSGIARRLVLKTDLNVVLASNLPKNTPMLEAAAERRLVQKLVDLGYTKPKSGASSSTQMG